MQRDTEEENEIEVPVDLPHFKVTEMEASLLRNSPFLVKDVYLLSINSLKAGFDSINLELQRAARNTRLADTCDPVYVERKNETVTSLRDTTEAASHSGNKRSGPSNRSDTSTRYQRLRLRQ